LNERYRDYFSNTSRKLKEGDVEISVSQHYADEPSSITFTLSYVIFTDINNELKNSAFCGGSRKATID